MTTQNEYKSGKILHYHKVTRNGMPYWEGGANASWFRSITSYRGEVRVDRTIMGPAPKGGEKKKFLIPNPVYIENKLLAPEHLKPGFVYWQYNGYDMVLETNHFWTLSNLSNIKMSISDPEFSGLHRRLDQAKLNAYSDANSPDFPGLVNLAELSETVTMVRDIIKAVYRLVIKYKAAYNKLLRKGEPETSLTNLWLQYRYGFTPLVLSMGELLETLRETAGSWESFSGYIEDKRYTRYSTGYQSLWNLRIDYTVKETSVWTGACKLYPVWNGNNSDLDWGIDAYDLILAAWEKTTLSFVVNWFIDVGGFLGAFRPVDAEIKYQSNTLLINKRREVDSFKFSVNGDTSVVSSTLPHKLPAYETFRMERTTELDRPLLPTFNYKRLGLLKQLDSAALLAGALKNLRK